MTRQKIRDVARIKELLPTVEKRAKISVNDHLGKGTLLTPIQTITDSDYKYYGEVNADGEEHGRGIQIWNDGDIWIGYFENGVWSTGNYIRIWDDGDKFEVGEYYMKDGREWNRYTEYKTNGTVLKYDRDT
jgi:hypothetical protein